MTGRDMSEHLARFNVGWTEWELRAAG